MHKKLTFMAGFSLSAYFNAIVCNDCMFCALFMLVFDYWLLTQFTYFNHCFASCTVLYNQLVFLILCSDCLFVYTKPNVFS